jgi:hypothetical protein
MRFAVDSPRCAVTCDFRSSVLLNSAPRGASAAPLLSRRLKESIISGGCSFVPASLNGYLISSSCLMKTSVGLLCSRAFSYSSSVIERSLPGGMNP